MIVITREEGRPWYSPAASPILETYVRKDDLPREHQRAAPTFLVRDGVEYRCLGEMLNLDPYYRSLDVEARKRGVGTHDIEVA